MNHLTKILKWLSAVDLLVALALLGYGLYNRDVWYIAASFVSFFFFFYKPSQRIQKKIESFMHKKRKIVDESETLAEKEKLYNNTSEISKEFKLIDYTRQPYGSILLKVRLNNNPLKLGDTPKLLNLNNTSTKEGDTSIITYW